MGMHVESWNMQCQPAVLRLLFIASASSCLPWAVSCSEDCQLTYTFPDGAKFGTIAKQFESHLCLSPILRKGWQTDRRFVVVVRYEGKVPAMASCSNCKRKFFTPTAPARDAVGAEEYLGRKFDMHECEELKR